MDPVNNYLTLVKDDNFSVNNPNLQNRHLTVRTASASVLADKDYTDNNLSSQDKREQVQSTMTPMQLCNNNVISVSNETELENNVTIHGCCSSITYDSTVIMNKQLVNNDAVHDCCTSIIYDHENVSPAVQLVNDSSMHACCTSIVYEHENVSPYIQLENDDTVQGCTSTLHGTHLDQTEYAIANEESTYNKINEDLTYDEINNLNDTITIESRRQSRLPLKNNQYLKLLCQTNILRHFTEVNSN